MWGASLGALMIVMDRWPRIKTKDGKEMIADDAALKDMGFDI